jgi:CheY-like chemotaxis protein
VLELEPKAPAPPGTESGLLARSAEPSPVTPRADGLLVVDDDEGVRGVLAVLMRHQDFAVWVAADGQEALDLYRRHREVIDVVLLDVRMPGMDGPGTLAALRELNPRMRCCFMSGDLGDYTEEGLCHLGAATLFRKPFRPAEAAQVLRELAKEARRRPFDW